jgi:predicted GH43/DUF377 family glycosyl hydrolase
MKYIILSFFLFTTLSSKQNVLNDILSGDMISKTYKIEIPDYENAHNPSIIPYQDGYLLSFRYIARFPEWFKETSFIPVASLIGVAHLDKHFQLKKKSVQLLEIQSYSEDFSVYAEDARLILFQDRIFLVFNDLNAAERKYIRRLYMVEITQKNGKWIPKTRATRLFLDNMGRIEKNWVPFFSGQSLYFIYGEEPHTIIECDPLTGLCHRVDERPIDLDWPYGIIRGGTPAIKIDDQFLTFYHSSLDQLDIYKDRIYFMGAYTFDPFFPFTIRSYTPKPIGLTEYYKETSSKDYPSKKVVFPGGIIREGNALHIAWGKDDKMVMITTFDLEKLLKSMKKSSYND